MLMNLFALVLLGVALGTDAFSVSLGLGFGGIGRRRGFILVGTVALFHILMPLVGWWLGETLGLLLGRVAGWLGAGLLFFLGVRMIYGSVQAGVLGGAPPLPSGLWGSLCLGASVSMDALSVGFTLGIYHFPPLVVAGVLGLIAGLMTAFGLGLGRTVSTWIGKPAQLIGGFILLAVGVQLLR